MVILHSRRSDGGGFIMHYTCLDLVYLRTVTTLLACIFLVCRILSIDNRVFSPNTLTLNTGESMTNSCEEGFELVGDATIICIA